ncbi:hypothetical protein JG687_00012241, partial [Phytophthora cactorum]
FPCRIYGNKTAWWNSKLSLKFLGFHFAKSGNPDAKIILLRNDFSGHWTDEVTIYANSLNTSELAHINLCASARGYFSFSKF